MKEKLCNDCKMEILEIYDNLTQEHIETAEKLKISPLEYAENL